MAFCCSFVVSPLFKLPQQVQLLHNICSVLPHCTPELWHYTHPFHNLQSLFHRSAFKTQKGKAQSHAEVTRPPASLSYPSCELKAHLSCCRPKRNCALLNIQSQTTLCQRRATDDPGPARPDHLSSWRGLAASSKHRSAPSPSPASPQRSPPGGARGNPAAFRGAQPRGGRRDLPLRSSPQREPPSRSAHAPRPIHSENAHRDQPAPHGRTLRFRPAPGSGPALPRLLCAEADPRRARSQGRRAQREPEGCVLTRVARGRIVVVGLGEAWQAPG